MPRSGRAPLNLRNRSQDAKRKAREALSETFENIKNPPIFLNMMEGVTRAEQITALFLLPFVIVFSFGLMLSMNLVLTNAFLESGDLGDQSEIMQFMVTALTLGMFILSAWFWFMWVRTGAFRLTRLEDPPGVGRR